MRHEKTDFNATEDCLLNSILAAVVKIENRPAFFEEKLCQELPEAPNNVLTYHTAQEVKDYEELKRLRTVLLTNIEQLKKGHNTDDRHSLLNTYETLVPRLSTALSKQEKVAYYLRLEHLKGEISSATEEDLKQLANKYAKQAEQAGELGNVNLQEYMHKCKIICQSALDNFKLTTNK